MQNPDDWRNYRYSRTLSHPAAYNPIEHYRPSLARRVKEKAPWFLTFAFVAYVAVMSVS